jgi:hypothetical protein
LIVLGILLLLDNLNITPDIDWRTIWKLWPVLLIALGLEVILGRRVSFGAILLMVLIVIVGGAVLWWSVAVGSGDFETQHFTWPGDGVERAEVELNVGIGKIQLVGASDVGELLIADMELAPGVDVSQSVDVEGDVAQGRITTDRRFFSFPQIFGDGGSKWDLRLNSRVRWTLNVDSGVGEAQLDLSDLRVSDLDLKSGVGSVEVTMPRRGTVRAKVDGGIGDIRITIPDGVQARISVDRGIGDLNVGSRFRRRGDFYETEGFSNAESFIDLKIDIGIGGVTVR